MSNLRRWLLILAPLPIFMAAWTFSQWARGDRAVALATNDVAPPQSHTPAVARSPDEATLRAACLGAAERWRRQLDPAAAQLIRPPFVLTGNVSAKVLERWHDETLAPARRALEASYFDTPPNDAVSVLLFADEASYRAASHRLFGVEHAPVYGFYRPASHTIVVNAATGRGTLLHELTHALAAFDFPNIPDWFNEGLAALHETSRYRPDGRLEGLVNWRHEGLQRRVQAGTAPSLAQLVTTPAIRGADEGLYYAQARCLCLYLQRQGKLETFYRELRAGHAFDPTGAKSLRRLWNDASWETIDQTLHAWALATDE